MQATLYKFNKRSNSTKVPSGQGAVVEMKLKDGCSIYSPSFLLSSMDPTLYNYVEWNESYYFIQDAFLVRQGLWEIQCKIDVLASYRTQILNTSAFVTYSSNVFNTYIPDTRLSTNANANVALNNNKLITNSSEDDGTYIITYITNHPNHGMAGAIWADTQTAKNISACINSAGMNDFLLNDLKKQLSNVNQAVRSCRYVPMQWFEGRGDANYTPPRAGGGGGSSGGEPTGDFTPRLNRDGMADLIYYNNPINPFYPNLAPPIVGQGNCTWYAWGRFGRYAERRTYQNFQPETPGPGLIQQPDMTEATLQNLEPWQSGEEEPDSVMWLL